ncbi:response regulator [Pleurocapsales cyanobacterium LEGE 06147]|nr:response regulator [Pleurocapsales cyanobacterium LEGE 06147]
MSTQSANKPKADILVIDDTPENLALLSQMLTEKGYKVRSVTKGSTGIRGAKAALPDLILLDVKMPQMNGYEVCEQLKADERTRNIPIIFISALGDVGDKVKAFQAGGVDYITKPFQVEEVLARVDTHLIIQRLQNQLQQQNTVLQQEIKERAAAEEKFAKAFRSCPSPIAIATLADGHFVDVNRSFLMMSGYTQEEIIGRPMAEIYSESAMATFTEVVQQSQQKGFVRNQEFQFSTKLGAIKIVLLSLELIELGGTPCSLSILNDITERKRLENEFISLVSHELRTPMTSMMGALDLLSSGQLGTLTDQGKQVLDIATKNTERLIRLVNDILDLERMKSGKITMKKVRCNMAQLLIQAVETMKPMAEQARVNLKLEPCSVELEVDPDRIIQTFTNLLSNAIKFSEPGKTVWLKSVLNSKHLQITVEDRGRGIPADKLQVIFERFQQVDTSDSRQKGGTGLGLAICRHIVEQHDGRIWVESEFGRGSTFYITLPLSDEAKGEALVI